MYVCVCVCMCEHFASTDGWKKDQATLIAYTRTSTRRMIIACIAFLLFASNMELQFFGCDRENASRVKYTHTRNAIENGDKSEREE